MTAVVRNNIGAVLSVTGANAIASGAYASAADKLVVDNTTGGALCADFVLTVSFGTAPVTGSIGLMMVDYSLDNATAGPAPTATLLGKFVGSFSPSPAASNALLTWQASINTVAIPDKADFYLANLSTGQAISAGWVLKAQCWSPG